MTGHIGAKDLKLDPESGEKDLFRWFLASLLFGKRIQEKVARQAFDAFMKHGVDSPRKILDTGWQGLVDILGEGHYVRYDESTARMLLETSELLLDRYDGKVSNVFEQAENPDDLERRLEEFKGVGPKTAEIFLREVDRQTKLGSR